MGKAETLRAALGHTADALVAVTLAPRCVACDAPLDRPLRSCVCASCLAAPAMPPPRWSSEVITTAAAGGDFDGVLREMIHAFKYDGRRSLGPTLSALMKDAGQDVLIGADVAVPVPLHLWRHLTRGFNQASDLAHGLGLPVAYALWRVRRTSIQSGLSAAARRRNVRRAFSLSPLLTRHSRDRLRGATVVLVDDVRTTGETLNACAGVLLASGVREVRAVTAAARDLR